MNLLVELLFVVRADTGTGLLLEMVSDSPVRSHQALANTVTCVRQEILVARDAEAFGDGIVENPSVMGASFPSRKDKNKF